MTGPDRRRAGAIIKEIRDASGANLKILTPDELPPCALANDRVVQCARCSLSPATFLPGCSSCVQLRTTARWLNFSCRVRTFLFRVRG